MNIKLDRTKLYYKSEADKNLCDCEYCKNYYKNIKKAYPQIDEYLKNIGVDIEKPFETSPVDPEDGFIEYYMCQYIVFGRCPNDYKDIIDDIEIRIATSYPDTKIDEEHFLLEIDYIKLNKNCV